MTLPARFYLDEDVPHSCASVGNTLGLDIVPATDVHPWLPQDDPVHLWTAGEDERILVTYNRNDFLAATRDAFASNSPHSGILILTHRMPRDPVRIAHALTRWVSLRQGTGAWPMQDYEVDFLST